jgi:hypothetical protein
VATQTSSAAQGLTAATGPPINTPIIFAHGQAYQIQGQYAIPLPPHEVAKLIQMGALAQVPQAPTAGPIPNGNHRKNLTSYESFFSSIFITTTPIVQK